LIVNFPREMTSWLRAASWPEESNVAHPSQPENEHGAFQGRTVTVWKKELGVLVTIEGTSKLRSAHFHEPWAREAQKKAWAKARDAGRREKIAAARRGKPRPAHVIEAMRKANLGKQLSPETRRKMSEAHKRRGAWPPAAGRPWKAEEDELVRTLRIADVVKRTGRTESAVKNRRVKLGVPDGRTKAARQKRG
jgi:hypothetical protein